MSPIGDKVWHRIGAKIRGPPQFASPTGGLHKAGRKIRAEIPWLATAFETTKTAAKSATNSAQKCCLADGQSLWRNGARFRQFFSKCQSVSPVSPLSRVAKKLRNSWLGACRTGSLPSCLSAEGTLSCHLNDRIESHPNRCRWIAHMGLDQQISISFSQGQPKAFCSRSTVVSRMLMLPASIFCTVRILRSANSANFSWVKPLRVRSRRTLAPKARSLFFSGFDGTPY